MAKIELCSVTWARVFSPQMLQPFSNGNAAFNEGKVQRENFSFLTRFLISNFNEICVRVFVQLGPPPCSSSVDFIHFLTRCLRPMTRRGNGRSVPESGVPWPLELGADGLLSVAVDLPARRMTEARPWQVGPSRLIVVSGVGVDPFPWTVHGLGGSSRLMMLPFVFDGREVSQRRMAS